MAPVYVERSCSAGVLGIVNSCSNRAMPEPPIKATPLGQFRARGRGG